MSNHFERMADLSKEIALSSISAGVQTTSTTVNWLVLASATTIAWVLNTYAAPESTLHASCWLFLGLAALGLSAASGVAHAVTFNLASARTGSMNVQLVEKFSLIANATSLVEKHTTDGNLYDALEPLKATAAKAQQEAADVVNTILPEIQRLSKLQRLTLGVSGGLLVFGELFLAIAVFA